MNIHFHAWAKKHINFCKLRLLLSRMASVKMWKSKMLVNTGHDIWWEDKKYNNPPCSCSLQWWLYFICTFSVTADDTTANDRLHESTFWARMKSAQPHFCVFFLQPLVLLCAWFKKVKNYPTFRHLLTANNPMCLTKMKTYTDVFSVLKASVGAKPC